MVLEIENIITTLLELLISAGIIFVFRYLIPWLNTKFKKETLDFVSVWVTEAVKAAEQTHGDGEGRVKKEEVVKFVHDVLQSHKISLSEEQIDILIESAVKQLKIELLHASSN